MEMKIYMQKISELLFNESNFQVMLRNDNYFDSEEYERIKNTLLENAIIWKKSGTVPIDDLVALMSLVDQLAGGSRFYDEKTSVKVEDACIEIQDIINSLLC
ncbi:MAG: hypothetical protein ACI4JT_03715 [Oscillospiraceae bacterium]